VVVERSASIPLPAEFGHADITDQVARWVRESGMQKGLATIQIVGSTGGISTIEYEPGALEDLRRALEQIAPTDGHYEHNERWGDGNGFSHLRSALLKTSIGIPFVDGRLRLGTWQQILVLNFDNKPRDRTISAVLIGE